MFGWLKAVASRIGGGSQQAISLVANWLANVLWMIETKFMSLAKEAYGGNSIVYACLRMLSQSVPEAPLRAYRKGKEEREALDEDDPLMKLIHRPNELMTEYEFWELTTLQMAITGRSTWFKERDNKGVLIALWPLRPDRVGPIYAGSDSDDALLSGYSYQIPSTGSFIAIPRKDVLAFNLPNLSGESGGIVEGLGPSQVLAREISADNEATDFVGALLANYAAPTVAIRTKVAIKDEAKANLIKAKFKHEFGGSRRGMPAIIDGDTSVDLIGFNLQQLEFPGVRANTESRICAAYGVPPILVGVNVGLQGARGIGGGGVITGLRQYFTETTLANYWRRFSDQYTMDIAVEYGEDIVCEFDTSMVVALAGRRQEKLAPIEVAFQRGGATRNEYREALGLEADDDGDIYLVPTNVISTGVEEPAPIRSIKAVDSREGTEESLRKALAELFEKTRPSVAASLRRGDPINWLAIDEAISSIITVELSEAATEETLRIARSIGVEFDPALINAEAVAWAKRYSFDLIRGLNDTSRKVVSNALEEFLKTPGMTRGELEFLLEPAFGPVRAEAIAVTETTRAYSQAASDYQERLGQQGIKMEKVWLTNNDELVCPICGPKHLRPENEWSFEFPSGPPAHPRCRCSSTLRVVEQRVTVEA
jgi:HK97 family phage portal protein